MVNISDLIGKRVLKEEIEVKLDVKKFSDSYETYDVLEPIEVSGILSMAGDVLYLDGIIKGAIRLTCSRCLKTFRYDLRIELHERLTNNPENKDDEIIFINNDKLDLTEIVENNIIMSLPIQRLCREDCKGLCPSCGKDLNFGSCNCKNSEVDPRLAKLKDLFSND